MWQIFKTELQYSRAALVLAYGICLAFFVTALSGLGDLMSYMASSAITFFISVAAMGSESDKERRDRLYSLLPVPITRISLFRLAFCVMLQFTLVASWVVLWLFQSSIDLGSVIWVMFFANGVVLSIILLFAIYHDLSFFQTRKYKTVYWCGLAVLILFVALNQLLTRGDFSLEAASGVTIIFKSGPGALFFSLLWMGLFYLNFRMFMKRASYLA